MTRDRHASKLRELTERRHARPALVMFLRELHEASFPPDEQQFTTDFMLEHAGRDGFRLMLIEVGHDVVGYLFLRIREEQRVGYLWYMAVAPEHRDRGYGAEAIAQALGMVKREHPGVRALLLESHRPDPEDHHRDAKLDERRIRFYQRLGASRVRGIDYGMPAADDPARLLHYEILFFDLDGGSDPSFLRERIAIVLRANFPAGDERVEPMLASLSELSIEPPPGV